VAARSVRGRPGLLALGLALGAGWVALAGALASCQTGVPVAGRIAPPVEAGMRAQRSEARGFGYLHLTVRWPGRDRPGFTASLIPPSTNALVIDTLEGTTRTSRNTIARPSGQTSSQATLRVEAGNNLSVAVKAYRQAEPDPATDQAIAQGTTIVNIVRSRTTTASVTLDALFAPAVTSLDVNSGKVGDTIRVRGQNLGMVGQATPSLKVLGTAGALIDATVVPRSAGELDFVVPAGAATGKLVIASDGSQTTSDAVFWVLSSINLDAPRPVPSDNSTAAQRMVRYGRLIDLKATMGWVLAAGRTVAEYGTPPAPTWASSAPVGEFNAIQNPGVPAAGTVLPGGTVADGNPAASVRAAGSNGQRTDITASLPALTSGAITLIPVGIDAVTLNKTSVSLNAAPLAGATPAPLFAASQSVTLIAGVTSTLPFASGVTWTSSDQARATVDSSGKVSVVAGAPAGTAEIAATAVEDAGRVATASVTLTSKGGLVVGID